MKGKKKMISKKQQAIIAMKQAMQLMKRVCGECNVPCNECPFFEYCNQLDRDKVPVRFIIKEN